MNSPNPIRNETVLQDIHQNYWQLGCILGAAMGLPAMFIGGLLVTTYGAAAAIASIIIGNLILWAIGLGIIAMTEGRNNAIENIKEYLGGFTGVIASLVIVVAFICWFSVQIDGSAEIFSYLLKEHQITGTNLELRIGAILGFLCALISIGGIKLIKYVALIGVPFMLIYQIYSIAQFGISVQNWQSNMVFSFPAVAFIVISWLPGSINLSTFFRHAKSRADSFLGLSIMTLIHIIFQLYSVVISISQPFQLWTGEFSQSIFYIVFTCLFAFMALFSLNLANIYFASAGWETIVPQRFHSPKKYAVIGMLGTLTYTFLQKESYMSFLQDTMANFIACLAIVLLLSFLIRVIVKHRPRPYEKFVNSLCWFFGCLIAAHTQILLPANPPESLISGISASVVLFLIIIFLEETIWSMQLVKAETE